MKFEAVPVTYDVAMTSQISGKWSQFYDFDISQTWEATQSFTRNFYLTKCTLLKVIQRFIMFWSFFRRIRHIYDVRMSAKWRNLVSLVIFCTLQVTQSIVIVFIHAKSVLYEFIQHLTESEAVPVTLWRHRCRKNCWDFKILALITLGKQLNHLLESRILLNVL